MHFLKNLAQNPLLNIISGLVLLASASYDVFDIIEETNEIALSPGVGVHHGVFIFSIVHILKALPDVMEGLQELNEVETRKNGADS